MILLAGIPSETPLALVRAQLDESGADYVLLNQRSVADAGLELEVDGGRVGGVLTLGRVRYGLDGFRGAYIRLMDDQALPEVEHEAPDSPRRLHCRAFHDTLARWLDVAPGRVVNRLASMGSNGSKPYQAQLIAEHGLRVPETLVTNDPERVLAFRERHGRLVYKSTSGIRSIVRELEGPDLARLDAIRRCPVQFQEYVAGVDVRVHVVGEDLHATRIEASGTDYRYADDADLRAVGLPTDLAEACVRLADGLGLDFAGIDLRIPPEGRAACLEVNPCPAYSYFELQTGQPIARSVARHLLAAA